MSLERLKNLKKFLDFTFGARWHKVNLHVHASGHDPEKIIDEAIKAGISLMAVTDHNTFRFVKGVQEAAEKRADNDIVILPGIEITLLEGAHIIAIFDADFDDTKQKLFLGALKITTNGSEKDVVRDKTCTDVLKDITDFKGITVVPHPYSEDIGFLDRARKIPTKMEWLESGNIGLIQLTQEKVLFVDFETNGKWQNRFILSKTPPTKVSSTDYSLSPINTGEAHKPEEMENGSTWLKLGNRTVRGLRQITCEPRTCISRDAPVDNKKAKILGIDVKGGFFNGLKTGFSSDFSCIFGENHSGKTAIFDFISC